MVALPSPQERVDLSAEYWHPSPAPDWIKWCARLGNRLWHALPWVEHHAPQKADHHHWLRAGSRTVKGNYRKQNQDRCYVDLTRGILLIADGMGGYEGGELASQIIVETIPRELAAELPGQPKGARGQPKGARGDEIPLKKAPLPFIQFIRQAMRRALLASRREMIAAAMLQPGLQRMGSTLAMGLIVENVLYYTRVGDCRVYLIRKGRILPLTVDETLVQELVDAGVLSKQEAMQHPWRARVSNAVSVNRKIKMPEVGQLPVLPGDKILLTTDGLTDVLEDAELNRVIHSQNHPQRAADSLVRQALRKNSKDNVSCVLVKLSPQPPCVDAQPISAHNNRSAA